MSRTAFDQFREAFIAGDADRLADAFEPDGIYATNTGLLLGGRDQIRHAAAAWFDYRPPGAVVELEVRVLRHGQSDRLRWELLAHRQHGYVPDQPDAGNLDESGHALAVYHHDDDGTWRIRSVVVNRRKEREPMPRRTPEQHATVATMIDIAEGMAAQTQRIARRDVVEVGDVELSAEEDARLREALLHIEQAASDLKRLRGAG